MQLRPKMLSKMLQSFRASPSSSRISVLHLQSSYCSTGSNRREKILRTRAAQKQLYGRIIQTNSNGKVTAPEPANNSIERKVDQVHVRTDRQNEMKVTAPERASEFYWLVQKGQDFNSNTNKKFKVIRFSNSTNDDASKSVQNKSSAPETSSTLTKNTSPNSTNWNQTDQTFSNVDNSNTVHSSQFPKMSAKNAIITAKNLIQELVSNRGNSVQKQRGQDIPFDAAALSSILNYPIISNKSTLSQIEDLLADRSIRLPSISKVLQATMPESSRIALRKWKLGKIAELGLDGFKEYEQETLARGKNFHAAIEDFLSQGTIPTPDSSIIKLWDSIDNSLKELKPKPVLLEQPILHAELKYKGIIDNVSIVKDELCAFEWKTSEKAKPRLTSTYDAPVQLCAYLGALNSDPRYDLTVKNGCVVVAYKNGDSANVFNLTEADLRKYWMLWLQRLQEYWIRVRDGTLPDPI